MSCVSVFCDEAGLQDMSEGSYLLTLIMHDQDKPIGPLLEDYESRLRSEGLPDIPFHMVDLLHGRKDYEGLGRDTRWRLLLRFSTLVRRLPISYHTFSYGKYDVTDSMTLLTRMRRDIVDFIYANLERFQSFDKVVGFYDQGQSSVTNALHQALDYMLSGNSVEYRDISYQDRRLAQTADYICSIELAAQRYAQEQVSGTYRLFYGTASTFRRNFLKQTRRKLIDGR